MANTQSTTIINNGAKIKVTVGTLVRNIMKAQIKEVTIIKTNIIKIDVGQGALHNLFIPFTDVTNPATADAPALRDAILAFLEPTAGAGGSTEARQVEEIALQTSTKGVIDALQTIVNIINSKLFFSPLLIDDGGAGVVYKGYATIGTSQEFPNWAIERIQKVGDVDVHTWANGNQNFTNDWNFRESLAYS